VVDALRGVIVEDVSHFNIGAHVVQRTRPVGGGGGGGEGKRWSDLDASDGERIVCHPV
jgi:hypothetical protein